MQSTFRCVLTVITVSGNFPRLFDRHGWNFMNELEDKYGSVVKLTGPLGVCFIMTHETLLSRS